MYTQIAPDGLVHELTNRRFKIDSGIRTILRRVDGQSCSISNIISQKHWGNLQDKLNFMINERILIPSFINEQNMFYPHMVDIETVRHCNAHCAYCPQSINPKSKAVMPWYVFEKILSSLEGFHTSWIALNHYGEPLIDPLFRERVKVISQRHNLFLATNGVLMTQDLIDFLSEMSLHTISFNFPSINIEQWSNFMGLPQKLFPLVKKAIELSVRRLNDKANINIIVQSAMSDQIDRMKKIRDHFTRFGEVSVIEGFCRSRAGEIKNNHVISANYENESTFTGCDRIVAHLHVSWEGMCYLCCEDYNQQITFGNILNSDIMSVMKSDFVNQLRAEIYGLVPMRKNLICRKCAKIRR